MLLLVLSTVALGWGAWRLAEATVRRGTLADRIAAACVWAWAGVVLLTLVGSSLVALDALFLTVLTIGTASLLHGLLPRGVRLRWPTFAWTGPALVGVLLGLTWRLVAWKVGLVWDDFAYHAVAPAWWVHRASLEIPPFTYQGYYPFNAELMNLWFMLPLHSDVHANVGAVVWAVGLPLAGLRIASHTGQRPLFAYALWTIVMAAPGVAGNFGRFVPNDLAAGAGLLLAMAFAFTDGEDEGDFRRMALISGAAAGLAIGTKVAVAPAVAVLGAWWLGHSLQRKDVRAALAFCAPLLLLGTFWYVRNLVLTGNPLFPAELGPFDGPFPKDVQQQSSIVGIIMRESPEARLDRVWWFVRKRLNWPWGVGLAAIGGLPAGLAAAWWHRRTHPGRTRFLLMLCAAMGLMLLQHPSVPFSGGNNRPYSQPMGTHRYLLPVFVIGVSMVGAALPRRERIQEYTPWVVLLTLPIVVFGLKLAPIPLGGVAVAYAGAFFWRARPELGRWLPHATVALILALLVSPGLTGKEQRTDEEVWGWDGRRRVGKAWKRLEALPEGSHIVSYSRVPTSNLIYPLFGRNLQHTPVDLDPAGRLRPLLHERWSAEDSWWADHHISRVPAREFVRNLREAGVEFVLVTRWDNHLKEKKWCWQRTALLEVLGKGRRRFGDGYSEIYDLRGRDVSTEPEDTEPESPAEPEDTGPDDHETQAAPEDR